MMQMVGQQGIDLVHLLIQSNQQVMVRHLDRDLLRRLRRVDLGSSPYVCNPIPNTPNKASAVPRGTPCAIITL